MNWQPSNRKRSVNQTGVWVKEAQEAWESHTRSFWGVTVYIWMGLGDGRAGRKCRQL